MSMCRVFSCVLGRACLLWPVCSLGKTLLAFALLHSVLLGQICLLLQVFLDFLLLHSRMFGSRWVIAPLWLSGSWRSFLYSSSVYSCNLFLISSAFVRAIPFLSFIEPIFAWNVPLVPPIFLKKTTQEKTLHIDVTRWSTPKSDWLYSLLPKMEKLYTVSKNKTGSWLWLRSWTPYCQIQT